LQERLAKHLGFAARNATSGTGLVQRTLTLFFVVVVIDFVVHVVVAVVSLQACLRH